ncbi:MAG: response regulator transcription factor [Bacteroidetes bacterium]|nr:response regulator transcription factor [Bacteroidota bacterium]
MSKITCAIVEDDAVSLSLVEGLAERTGMLEVMGKFGSPMEAIPWLAKNEVDLLFLDIEMPGMTGLEMLGTLTYKPEVIVISGKTGYAVDAFNHSVADYLVKPIKDYARFLTAVNRVAAKQKNKYQRQEEQNTLFVKVDSLLLKLDTETILWIEAFGDYIKIQTEEKTLTVYSTLKKLEEKLDPKKFVRVHRSFVVNLTKVTNVDMNNIEIDKRIIPVSLTYKESFLAKLNIL